MGSSTFRRQLTPTPADAKANLASVEHFYWADYTTGNQAQQRKGRPSVVLPRLAGGAAWLEAIYLYKGLWNGQPSGICPLISADAPPFTSTLGCRNSLNLP